MFVSSAPRAANYHGQVFLFDFPNNEESAFRIRAKLEGTQMGEYFGATVAVTDFDGDGLDDLLV